VLGSAAIFGLFPAPLIPWFLLGLGLLLIG